MNAQVRKPNRVYWLCMIAFFVSTLPVHAMIPDNINYQGYLTNSTGIPITGNKNITFLLYNLESGGIALWSDTLSVSVNKGLFDVQLGHPGNLFPLVLFDNPLWLGIRIEGESEMIPRKPVSSNAFAYKADDAYTLDGMIASSLDQSAHVADMANPHSVSAAQIGAVSETSFNAHASNISAHHSKTSNFTELSGQIADAQVPSSIARDSEIIPIVLANDGPGSTLNADTLDGLNSTAFMNASTDNWVNTSGDTMTGNLTLPLNGLVAGTDQLILKNGYVGIGTTNPLRPLDIQGDRNDFLANFENHNSHAGQDTYGIMSYANGYFTQTGDAWGGVFRGQVGDSGNKAYGISSEAIAYGNSNAYGIYSNALIGPTTGREYAFYGLGDGYFSGYVGIGTDTPPIAYPTVKFEVLGSVSPVLARIENRNTLSANAIGLQVTGDVGLGGTGTGIGASFVGVGGATNGKAYGSQNYAYAYGTEHAYGVYSNATFGATTGREYAFYGIGEAYFSGSVGIGTDTPTEKLVVRGDGTAWQQGFVAVKNINQDAGFRLYDSDSTVKHHIFNSNSEGDVLRIAPDESYIAGGITVTQNGSVGIGTKSPSYTLHVNGTVAGTSWTTLSSREFKENIQELDENEAIEVLNRLRASHYNYKAEYGGEQHVGFIAEEVPEMLAAENGKGVKTIDLVAVLTKVVQKQQRDIEAQQQAIAALMARLEARE